MNYHTHYLILLALIGLGNIFLQFRGMVIYSQVHNWSPYFKHSFFESTTIYLEHCFLRRNRTDSVFPWVFMAISPEPNRYCIGHSLFELEISQPELMRSIKWFKRKIITARNIKTRVYAIPIKIGALDKFLLKIAVTSIFSCMDAVEIDWVNSDHWALSHTVINFHF